MGESEWSEVAASETQATVPGAPQPPIVDGAAPTSIFLRWLAPPDNGSPILEYLVERDDGVTGELGTIVYNGPNLECEATGLEVGPFPGVEEGRSEQCERSWLLCGCLAHSVCLGMGFCPVVVIENGAMCLFRHFRVWF